VTLHYLDTSIAVHALRGTPEAEAWFDDVTADPRQEIVSSRILQTELTRVLRRDGNPVLDREAILGHVGLVPLGEAILTTAESIADHVKTLDAIHLATALALGSGTVVVTHDENVKRVAASLGLSSSDPIASRPS